MLDAHIANVASEHFPAGYFPIPYTLTPPWTPNPSPSSPSSANPWRPPSLASGTSRAIPTWPGELTPPASTSPGPGVYQQVLLCPTTLAVELKLSQVSLAGLNKSLKLCTAAASKEFVNSLALQEMLPQGLDPEQQWLWVDRVKESVWKRPTATDAVVQYQTVKVQAWDAVDPVECSTNRRLSTHIPDIMHPTLYSTNAPFTMLGLSCPHPSFHNSYPVGTTTSRTPPSSRRRVLPRRATATMTTSSLRICGPDWRSRPR